MKRWIVFAAAAFAAVAAVWWWIAARPGAGPDGRGPHADIDAASRAALERILEEDERGNAQPGTASQDEAPR